MEQDWSSEIMDMKELSSILQQNGLLVQVVQDSRLMRNWISVQKHYPELCRM